jgi:hypothetical protein
LNLLSRNSLELSCQVQQLTNLVQQRLLTNTSVASPESNRFPQTAHPANRRRTKFKRSFNNSSRGHPVGNGRFNRSCFICSDSSHFARNCPHKQTRMDAYNHAGNPVCSQPTQFNGQVTQWHSANSNGSTGYPSVQPQHISEQCANQQYVSQQNASVQPPVYRVSSNLSEQSHAPVYLQGVIEAQSTLILVDSGSDISIVPLRMVMMKTITPCTTRIFAANGSPLNILGTSELSFTINNLHFRTVFFVSQEVDEVILGISWLRQESVTWNFASDILLIRSHSVKLVHNSKRLFCRRIFVAETTVVPVNTQHSVKLIAPLRTISREDGPQLVESTGNAQGIFIPLTVFPSESIYLSTLVCNTTNESATLPQGMFVTLTEPVTYCKDSDNTSDQNADTCQTAHVHTDRRTYNTRMLLNSGNTDNTRTQHMDDCAYSNNTRTQHMDDCAYSHKTRMQNTNNRVDTNQSEHTRTDLPNTFEHVNTNCDLSCSETRQPSSHDTQATVQQCRAINQSNTVEDDNSLFSPFNIAKEQQADPEIAPIYFALLDSPVVPPWTDMLQQGATTKVYWTMWQRLLIQNGILYRRWADQFDDTLWLQIILPYVLLKPYIKQCHVKIGHFGANKVCQEIHKRAYFKGWRQTTRRIVRQCPTCARYHRGKLQHSVEMQQMLVGDPMDRMGLDLCGPFPRSYDNQTYILTCIDYHTKWAEAVAIPNKEARTVAKAFVDNVVCRLGCPLQILTDQGSEVDNNIFKAFCERLNIDKIRTSAYSPATNGLVERLHRTMNALLAKTISEHQLDWTDHLPFVMSAYRAAIHSSTGYSPNFLMLARDVYLPLDVVFLSSKELSQQSQNSFVDKRLDRMRSAHIAAREALQASTARNIRYYDMTVKTQQYKPGDWVWFYKPRHVVGRCPKWEKLFSGPFLVLKQIGPANCVIQQTPTSQIQIVHTDK